MVYQLTEAFLLHPTVRWKMMVQVLQKIQFGQGLFLKVTACTFFLKKGQKMLKKWEKEQII